jgi:hypothetical protein
MRGGDFDLIPLDYQSPEPPQRIKATWPVLRFGSGLLIGILFAEAIYTQQNNKGDDDPCCGMIGAAITIAICCGLFWVAMIVRGRMSGKLLRERHIMLTIASGAAMFGIMAICSELYDRIFATENDAWVVFPGLFGLPVLCSWIAFKPAEL